MRDYRRFAGAFVAALLFVVPAQASGRWVTRWIDQGDGTAIAVIVPDWASHYQATLGGIVHPLLDGNDNRVHFGDYEVFRDPRATQK